MKPEDLHRLIKFLGNPFLLPVLLLLFITAQSKASAAQDTIPGKSFPLIRPATENLDVSALVSRSAQYNILIPPFNRDLNRTKSFLDTLKTRASRNLITRKLYDFMIINRSSGSVEKAVNESDATFLAFEGKKIRNIYIKRLNVFGSSVYNPDSYYPNGIEKLLNKTHVNTNENIIRKYLLFHEGDTLSPLTLSDNERLLRNLSYIDDSRIFVTPVSDNDVDVTVITKDVYSLGANAEFRGIRKGSLSVFDENIFGTGQEFRIDIPWNDLYKSSPGIGINYKINNISGSFSNLDMYFYDGLGRKSYGFSLSRNLVSSETKYAGGISVGRVSIFEDFDNPVEPAPVRYTLQDYWLQRSFLINKESVSRIVLGVRYTNNNVFDHPFILPETFYNLQKYKLFLGSFSFSMRKFYKASLIYNYGRTEDIPFGGSINLVSGLEINEFKRRTYLGATISVGETLGGLGYLQSSAGVGTFFNDVRTEQGVFTVKTSLISRLYYIGNYKVRNFLKADYIRGFDRYKDERLYFIRKNGFSGFRNDSIGNAQRLIVGIESVLFTPVNFYGFRFAGYIFADGGALYGLNEGIVKSTFLASIGIGLRIRNDNLVLNTFQIRFGYYPNPPRYSNTEPLIFSGEQLLEPVTFEPLPPSLVPYE